MSKISIVSSGYKGSRRECAKENHENTDVVNLPIIDIAKENLKIDIKGKEEKVNENFHYHSKKCVNLTMKSSQI